VYLIAPHTYQTIPMLHALLAIRLSDSATAIEMLKNVRLLQYFDLAGLAESLSEVSEAIYRRTQQENDSTTKVATINLKDLVLIQGIEPTILTINRRSGFAQANALLAGLVRNIVHLSRVSSAALILVDTEVEAGSHTEALTRQYIDSETLSAGLELDTAFSSSTGQTLRLVCGSGTLPRTLATAFDCIVIVHNGFGRLPDRASRPEGTQEHIVEVVKDRVGPMVGLWGVWILNFPS